MKRLGAVAVFLALIAIVDWCGCSRLPTQMAGGSGSETVIGKALMPDGSPAAKAVIRLRSEGYLSPLNGLPASGVAQNADAVADDSGRFSVSATGAGRYCLEINTNTGHAKLLRLTTDSLSKPFDIGVMTLENTASVMGMARDAAGGNVQIFGLERLTSIDSTTGAFSFSDLPPGTYSFRLVPKILPQSVSTISYVKLIAGDVQYISLMSGWTFSKRLYFNTTALGANVFVAVNNFPVLIRLTGDIINFAEFKSDGADIRFAKSDNTLLPYEIERWNPDAELAEAWVKVDTILGNDSTHFITMYWGNPDALGQSNSASVFDTANGFQGVWHLQEMGKNNAPDATGNHFDGIPSDTAPTPIAGPIGTAQQFNGISNYIDVVGTANSVLSFPEDGTYSISAWVKVDRFVNESNAIVSKQLYQYTLQIRNDNFWEFHIYANTIGFESTASSATSGVWTHVVGVRSGKNQYFYVNGSLCASFSGDTVTTGNATTSRVTSNDVCIGRLPAINNPGQSWRYFTGAIDEVRISNIAQSADWIKLCYMNQRLDDKLVSFK